MSLGLLVYLQANLPPFFKKCGVNYDEYVGIIGSLSDKCRGYMKLWKENNIPFEQGVMFFMLGHTKEYEYQGDNIGEWVVGMHQLIGGDMYDKRDIGELSAKEMWKAVKNGMVSEEEFLGWVKIKQYKAIADAVKDMMGKIDGEKDKD